MIVKDLLNVILGEDFPADRAKDVLARMALYVVRVYPSAFTFGQLNIDLAAAGIIP